MIDQRSNTRRAWEDLRDPGAGWPVRLISLSWLLVIPGVAIMITCAVLGSL